jgi:hypothetical protein
MIREELRAQYTRGVRWRIRVMSECLAQTSDSQSPVYKDLQRGLKQFKSDLEMKNGLPGYEEHPAIRTEAEQIKWFASVGNDFGMALDVWPSLWHAAKDIQAKDIH